MRPTGPRQADGVSVAGAGGAVNAHPGERSYTFVPPARVRLTPRAVCGAPTRQESGYPHGQSCTSHSTWRQNQALRQL